MACRRFLNVYLVPVQLLAAGLMWDSGVDHGRLCYCKMILKAIKRPSVSLKRELDSWQIRRTGGARASEGAGGRTGESLTCLRGKKMSVTERWWVKGRRTPNWREG